MAMSADCIMPKRPLINSVQVSAHTNMIPCLLSLAFGFSVTVLQLPAHALPSQSPTDNPQSAHTRWLMSDAMDGVGDRLSSQRPLSKLLVIENPPPSLQFSPHSTSGLALIQQVWGNAIAEDFRQARFTDAVKLHHSTVPVRFYLGEQYGYRVDRTTPSLENTGIHHISVMPHEVWTTERNTLSFCQNNPEDGECLGVNPM